MYDEPAFVDLEQQILAAPLDLVDRTPAQKAGESGWNGPAQGGSANVDARYATARDIRLDSPTGNLNFRQFWHV
ncbi:hypothetical protein JCM10599A_05430 [Paraburkholderia kururiensis]